MGDFCLVCIIWVPCRVGQCPIAACRWTSLLDDCSFWLFWLWIRTPGFLDEHHTPNKNPLQQWDQRWDPSPLTDPPHFSNVFFFGGWWCFFLWAGHPNWHVGTADASVSSPSFTSLKCAVLNPYPLSIHLCNPGCLVRFIHWWNSSCSSDLDAFSLEFFSGNFVKNSSSLQGPFGDDDDDATSPGQLLGPPSLAQRTGLPGLGLRPLGAASSRGGEGRGGGELTPGAWRGPRGLEGTKEWWAIANYCYLYSLWIPMEKPIGARNWLSFDGDFWSKHGFLLMFYIFFMVDHIPRWCNPPEKMSHRSRRLRAAKLTCKVIRRSGCPSHAQQCSSLLQFKLHRGCKHWVYCMICMYM